MQNHYNPKDLGSFDVNKKYVIVSTEWNSEYVDFLVTDCEKTLMENWIKNIFHIKVPWSLELTYWAIQAFEKNKADIVIVIWTVIKWDTDHYAYVCNWVTQWITELQIKLSKPIIFGLLTCNNEKQVKERLYKWREWALSAIRISII